MIKIGKPIIVEGKYDKITLENVVDGLIIPTNGFGIFKDREKCLMIKELAQRNNGIIIMTDSDSAGSVIRAYIKNIVGNCDIINVYIPQLKGKEKRKTVAGKEGLLGVEGMTTEIILASLKKSGVTAVSGEKPKRKITKTDMFSAGLSGVAGSSDNRKKVLEHLGLPQELSPNAMLDVLNNILSYEEFFEVTEKCLKSQDKS